jgi:hypothetical protein
MTLYQFQKQMGGMDEGHSPDDGNRDNADDDMSKIEQDTDVCIISADMREMMETVVKTHSSVIANRAMSTLSCTTNDSNDLNTKFENMILGMGQLPCNLKHVGGVKTTIRVMMSGMTHFPLSLDLQARMKPGCELVVGRAKSMFDPHALGVYITLPADVLTGLSMSEIVDSDPMLSDLSNAHSEIQEVTQAGWIPKQVSSSLARMIDSGCVEVRSAHLSTSDQIRVTTQPYLDLVLAVSSDEAKSILISSLPSHHHCVVIDEPVSCHGMNSEVEPSLMEVVSPDLNGVSRQMSSDMFSTHSLSLSFSTTNKDVVYQPMHNGHVELVEHDVDTINMYPSSISSSSSSWNGWGDAVRHGNSSNAAAADATATAAAVGVITGGAATQTDSAATQHGHHTRSKADNRSCSSSPDALLRQSITDVNSVPEILDELSVCAADLRRLLSQEWDGTNPLRKRQLEIVSDIITRTCQGNTTGHTSGELTQSTQEWCADGQVMLGANKFEQWFRSVIPIAGLTSNFQETRKFRTGTSTTFHSEVRNGV